MSNNETDVSSNSVYPQPSRGRLSVISGIQEDPPLEKIKALSSRRLRKSLKTAAILALVIGVIVGVGVYSTQSRRSPNYPLESPNIFSISRIILSPFLLLAPSFIVHAVGSTGPGTVHRVMNRIRISFTGMTHGLLRVLSVLAIFDALNPLSGWKGGRDSSRIGDLLMYGNVGSKDENLGAYWEAREIEELYYRHKNPPKQFSHH